MKTMEQYDTHSTNTSERLRQTLMTLQQECLALEKETKANKARTYITLSPEDLQQERNLLYTMADWQKAGRIAKEFLEARLAAALEKEV
jgi:hypothetical protein